MTKALVDNLLRCSLLSLFFLSTVYSQSVSPVSATKGAPLASQGTQSLRDLIVMEEFSFSLDTSSVRESKSPGKATLLSALVPGLGQIYTKSYWKLPIIWGLGGYYVHEWIKNNNRYRDFGDQFLKSISASSPQGDLQVKNLRDFYRNQRDSFAWYFGILYLANIVDAYVTASLYEFDVSDDLSVGVGQAGRVLTVRWKW